MKYIFGLLLFLFTAQIAIAQEDSIYTLSDDLKIIRLTENSYLHKSYMTLEPYGRFSCNGLIFVSGGACYVFDTPADTVLSVQLIEWIQKELKLEIAGVVANHYHEDCLGGLEAFHRRGIPSFSSKKTQLMAQEEGNPVPQQTFGKSKKMKLNGEVIHNFHPGEAHSPDNIVSWIPSEKVLFGGCMVKSVGAGKGNLASANVEAWPETIRKVMKKCTDAEIVIPGHGKTGGKELLDFTIELFEKE